MSNRKFPIDMLCVQRARLPVTRAIYTAHFSDLADHYVVEW
jgi:hypothetical protein